MSAGPLEYTLPAKARIRRRSDFTRCYEVGRRYYAKYFILFVDAGQERWRIGLAVSKKNGHSPRRNRIKRVLREFFRLYAQALPPCDIVAVPRRELGQELAGLSVNLELVRTQLQPLLPRIAAHVSPK